ncbi:MAG: hypothetical protein EOO77_34995 [Oxalobacteraceae bacterium]|nr:MAG: hypothetical protein EOO77_34995 [Oxalobacteraceae bacterium]
MNNYLIDGAMYPSLKAYFDTMPQGILTHPSAQTRAFYSIELRKRLGTKLAESKLPFTLKQALLASWKPDDWIPATTYAALSCICADTLWRTQQEFHAGMYETASVMYASMLFRAVMFIMSPSLMMMGAASRWNGFHKGTSLRAEAATKTSGRFILGYPSKLFAEPCLRSLGATFDCAISGAGAKNFTYKMTDVSDSNAVYQMTWSV